VQMGAGLGMNGEHSGIELCEMTDVTVWRFDHQMHIQGLCGVAPDGFYDRHAITDVGDEQSVHHVDVVPVGMAAFDHLDITSKVGEVSSEQRRGDEMGHGAKMATSGMESEYCSMALSTSSPTSASGGIERPYCVGLTGGMGSGKSTVGSILQTLGYPVYDADQAAKSLYRRHPDLLRRVAAHFGSDILLPGGQLNRAKLASMVFQNAAALSELNDMVHPVVRADFSQWKAAHHKRGLALVFKESAILFESGSNKDCNEVWAVSAPESIRLQRALDRDGLSKKDIHHRMAHQMAAHEVESRANRVLDNSGRIPVIPQLQVALNSLLKAGNA